MEWSKSCMNLAITITTPTSNTLVEMYGYGKANCKKTVDKITNIFYYLSSWQNRIEQG